jgi:carboxyvinyl-carboxyphosphonate phosphorylmutase
MTGDTRRERFRALLSGSTCTFPGSVYDPLSARIAEDLGFEVGMFAGSIASMTVLGDPDLILVSLTEFAEQARRILRAGSLPLMVDADHGYGNALNVRRTVQELETAGICAMTIEDTALPIGFGDGDTTRLIPIAEGVGKMKAALDARRDPRLVIAGRTGALAVTGLDDAIARARAYEAAGVDAVFFTGVKTRDQLDALADALRGPILLGGTTPAVMERDYLASRKVRICLQGHQPFMAAVQAVHDTLKALREGTKPADLKGVASGALMKQVTREADFDRWTGEYLGG